MGHRTVVIVNNDLIDQAKNDPKFGEKFYYAVISHSIHPTDRLNETKGICTVVESNHADVVNLLLIDSLQAESLSTTHWNNPTKELDVLQEAALKLGYRLTKLPKSQQKD